MPKILSLSPTTFKHHIGIDPGQNGGLVRLSNGKPSTGLDCIPMPATERDIWDWFRTAGPYGSPPRDEIRACIEKVHSMPHQGVSSTFKFGVGYGGLRMALIATGIPFEEVTPQEWQKAFRIPPRKKHKKGRETVWDESPKQFKQRLRAKAQQLFPQVQVTLFTCDALLIAEFSRRKSEGKL